MGGFKFVMERWSGKVAVVTGASSGIGYAIAEKLVAAGMQVVGMAKRFEIMEELATKLNTNACGVLHPVKVDLTNKCELIGAMKWTTENVGPISILINNAGFTQNTSLSDGDIDVWRNVINVNVLGLCIATREAIRSMKANNIDGHIVHINSILGHKVNYTPGINVYGASKYAVTNLTEMLRLELMHAGSKIKITSVSPGLVNTPMADIVLASTGFSKDGIPILLPEDVADAVLYSLSTPPHVQGDIKGGSSSFMLLIAMERWSGKVAVVTGASSGIGYAIVEKLVAAGMQVVGMARRLELMEELAEKVNTGSDGKLHPLKTDMTNDSEIVEAMKWTTDNVGPISILINNAGIMINTSLSDGDSDLWRRIIDTNVIGLCIATREAIRSMKANNIDGHIVHINSIAGHKVNYVPELNVYGASKYAVTNLTEMLRLELVHSGSKIKITSVSPGLVDTSMVDVLFTPANIPKGAAPMVLSEDVADAVLYTLGTPPYVQIHEITIKPVGEQF